MMSRRRIHTGWLALAGLLPALAAPFAAAQVPDLPDTLPPQRLLLHTERFASTHTTSLAGNYRLASGTVAGHARTYLLSSTTLLGVPTTKDQVDAVVDLELMLPSSVHLFVVSEASVSNDVRNNLTVIPGINNTASGFIGVGPRFTTDDGLRAGVAVGGAYNRQLNVEDAGLAFYGELNGDLRLEDYRLRVDGIGRWHNLAPRHNANGSVDLLIEREFEVDAFGSLAARADFAGSDLYLKRAEQDVLAFGGPSYDALQSRGESRVRIAPTLRVRAVGDLWFDMAGFLTTATYDQREVSEGLPPLPRDPTPFAYGRNELEIGAIAAARWEPPSARVDLRLEYTSREQRNTVDAIRLVQDFELRRQRETGARNDFASRHLLVGSTLEIRPGLSDTIAFSGSVGIDRYDTPSEANYFDRDEQTLQAQLRWAHAFSPWLTLSITSQAYLTHLVYLSGRNSNDNNWNRVFRVAPAVHYRSAGVLENRFLAEVLANYTDYDFGGRSQNVRGRSFRELHLLDSFDVELGGTLVGRVRAELRISERGSFSWDRFAESLLERTRNEGVDAELGTTIVDGATFAAGGRLARLRTERAGATGALMAFSDRTSFGPTARLTATFTSGTLLELSGWWEHRFDESRLTSIVPWLFLTVGMNL